LTLDAVVASAPLLAERSSFQRDRDGIAQRLTSGWLDREAVASRE
jgi:hypothetical protein